MYGTSIWRSDGDKLIQSELTVGKQKYKYTYLGENIIIIDRLIVGYGDDCTADDNSFVVDIGWRIGFVVIILFLRFTLDILMSVALSYILMLIVLNSFVGNHMGISKKACHRIIMHALKVRRTSGVCWLDYDHIQ